MAAWVVWPSGAVAVRVAPVLERAAAAGGTTVLNATGYVTARRRATVSSKTTGKVVEVRVEEGLAVEGGQVLARLDDTLWQAALALARARLEAARSGLAETRVQLELARLTLGRTERLVAEGVAGQSDLDVARTTAAALVARLEREEQEVEVAERVVALSRAELDDTVIRAPFSGVVISKDAQPGEMVSPISAGGGFTRTGICTIVDMASLEIEVDVNENYISRVQPRQPVVAVLDAYPDWRAPAHVITAVPAADRQKATVLVRIGFAELDPRILPDMGVKVAFQDSGTAGAIARAHLLVPRAALRRAGDRDVVFVVREGRLERRAVALGPPGAAEVEIFSGVAAGEQVVIEGPAELAEGLSVVAQ